MTERTLYFDESGFTGYNLLDPLQPIFAIASTSVSNEHALEILSQSFPRYQGAEYKFSNIWRSNNRAGLLEFANYMQNLENQIYIYMVDKQFTVLTKMVDNLIEPYITSSGYNFYADGFCWKYANYVYYGLTHFAPPELLTTLLQHYQAFSRNPSEAALATLRSNLREMSVNAPKETQIFFEQMVLGTQLFEHFHNLENFHGSDDLHTTTMLAIIAYWRQHYTEDFSVIHDDSSHFLRSREMWRNITNLNVPPQLYRLGDGSDVEFPLRVISTTSMNSVDSYSIQFCDVLAGLATKHFSSSTEGNDRVFMDEILDAGLHHIRYNGIRPEPVFPDQIPPQRLNGPDPVDQMANIIFGEHNRRH